MYISEGDDLEGKGRLTLAHFYNSGFHRHRRGWSLISLSMVYRMPRRIYIVSYDKRNRSAWLTIFLIPTAEAFNVKLSEEVQKLTQEADKLTEEVIKARKSVPSRKAAALQARLEVVNEKEGGKQRGRRRAEKEHEELKQQVSDRPQGENKAFDGS